MKRNKVILNLVAIVTLACLLWPASLPAQESVTCESDVTVQAEDWLSKIAEKEYGDVLLYPALQAATNAVAASDDSYTTIDNADVIEPGWKICVPALEDAQAMMATIQLPSLSDSGANAADLTLSGLQNATYSGISVSEQPVTLTDGEYLSEPLFQDSAARERIVMVPYGVHYGDLDGDGVDDAVVFLTESEGGSGTFTYIAAQLNQGGQPVDAGSVWIEDRIQIISAAIEEGQVLLEVSTEGSGDAACCKNYKTEKAYALQDGQLTELPSTDEPLVEITTADLNGTSWKLIDLNGDLQPTLSDTEVTINFADGQISGSGGCNNYTADLTPDDPAVISIGPIAATRMACPEPILNQETAYFTALENAAQWGYLVGRLAIYYATDEPGYQALVFEPMAGSETTSALDQLTANTWQWVSLTDPAQQFDVESPESYTASFLPDGNIELVADCNNATASYTAGDDGTLTIEPGITTLALCPEGSRSEEFIQKLGAAAIYFFQDGNLYIDLFADGGTMEFSPVAAQAN